MSVADKAIKSLSAIPFQDIIAGPLNACIEAQSQAAMSTVKFIREVGLNTYEEDGQEKTDAVYVHFSFLSAGKRVNISVPLLTLVPIPYIAINTIDISFKAAITGADKTTDENNTSEEYTKNTKSKSSKGLGILRARKTSEMTTSLSSKRDSKATQDSTYSIEATIDVNVHAGQESMPAGMSKILELLNSSVEVCDPDGELTISETTLLLKENETAFVTLSYKNPTGEFEPDKIKVAGANAEDINLQNSIKVLTLHGAASDKDYNVTVEGNEKRTAKIKVKHVS